MHSIESINDGLSPNVRVSSNYMIVKSPPVRETCDIWTGSPPPTDGKRTDGYGWAIRYRQRIRK